MPLLKYLLWIAGITLFGSAASLVMYDIYLAVQLRRLLAGSGAGAGESAATGGRRPFGTIRWRLAQ